MEPEPGPLRRYTFAMATGHELGLTVLGHEIDTSDPATFCVYRLERGRRVCAAALSRRHVAGVLEAEDDDVDDEDDD